jgi:hypothetical protein
VSIDLILQAFGSSTFFASRAFLPAFLTALSLRYGQHIPMIQGLELIENAAASPTWFTHGGVIGLLGALSTLEFAATKNADARQIMDQIDAYSKTAMAAGTSSGLLSVADSAFIEDIQKAGLTDGWLPVLAAAPVFFFATLRGSVFAFLAEADTDDELGVQKLLAWLEDAYVTFGFFALLLYPAVMIPLLGLGIFTLFLIQKGLEKREAATQIPCASCGEKIFPCATACYHCDAAVESPTEVGALGQPKSTPATDPANQAYRLVSKKRCPSCATRLTERSVDQTCSTCGHQLNGDPDFANQYSEYISSRLPGTLLVTGLFSLIPIVGLIPGVIYYRLTLVAPFRGYIPFTKRLLIKFLIAILFFFLIALQIMPGIGVVSVPLMALTNFLSHRSAYLALANNR